MGVLPHWQGRSAQTLEKKGRNALPSPHGINAGMQLRRYRDAYKQSIGSREGS